MKAIAIVALLASSAGAEPAYKCAFQRELDEIAARETHQSLLGMVFSYGKVSVNGQELQTSGLGVDLERRIHRGWRAYAHYEYLWIGERDDERDGQDVIDGAGHRVHLGLRATLADASISHGDEQMRFYIDTEFGGGLMVAHDPRSTRRVFEPHAFVGLRVGYDFVFDQRHRKSSAVWEPEILLRAIAVEDGIGLMFAVGLGWGD